MVPTFPNLIIRASAGTGKTFQLANRFLKLLLAGADVDQILASTFARKAAGEILERILTRLADAALDDKHLLELTLHIEHKGLDAERCLELLATLLCRLHRLRIGTLDSFFVQLAGSLSLELGLPAGWRIVDDVEDARLRREAIREVLQSNSTSDLLLLVHLLTKGEAARSVTSQIVEAVSDLYDTYLEASPDAWQRLKRVKPLGDPELSAAIERLRGLGPFTHKTWTKSHAADIESALAGDWDSFIKAGVASKISMGESSYCRTTIDDDVRAAYQPLIDHARAELTNKLVNQNEGTRELLSHFDKAYRKCKRTERAMRFDDVTRSLAGYLPRAIPGHIAYRLDTRLLHLLLDEFQDTSLFQWQAMRPFAESAAGGEGRSLFCVGDVKQAIYGWRGGVSEIFDAAKRQFDSLEERVLDCSYRSSQVIIDTVNTAFADLSRNQAAVDCELAASTWSTGFAEHKTARRLLQGHARLTVAPLAGDGETQKEATLSYAAGVIAELFERHPGCSVGVLLRSNDAVSRMIYELRTGHNLAASEEGGNPLTDSVAVQLVLALLSLADHPADSVARYHVATSPLADILGFRDFSDDRAAAELALSIRSALISEGYRACVYRWTQGLAPFCDSRELGRLAQLVELAASYESRSTLRPTDFVRFVEVRKVEDPSAARVRVMTVHQAKGLQFDIVVMPQLEVKLAGQSPRTIVGRDRPTDPIQIVSRYASKQLQALLPDDVRCYFERWPQQSAREELCVLYVAMTRAVHALHMIIAPPKKSDGACAKTLAGLLRSSLGRGLPAEPLAVLYEHGSEDWSPEPCEPHSSDGMHDSNVEPTPAVRPAPILFRPCAGSERRNHPWRSPSSLEGGGKVDLGSRLRLDTGPADRGTLMHAWFEQVLWLDAGQPTDATLQNAVRRLPIGELDVPAELAAFRRMLANPAVRELLQRRAYAGLTGRTSGACTLDVYRERSFAMRDQDGFLEGTMDRLVVISDSNGPLAAEVLDFKTDRVAGAAIDDRVEFYRPQMSAYRRAASRITGLDASRIALRLIFVEPGVVREL